MIIYITGNGKQYDLYSNLRCGLLHLVLPGKDLELIQENEIEKYGNHLEIKHINGRDRLILVSQRLMSDFEDACNEVIRRINENELSKTNLNEEILLTSRMDIEE